MPHEELVICSIFRNEAPYLREWIEFHRLQGVEHFYLIDNESTDNPLEVLQTYIDRKIVTYSQFPGTSMQLRAYQEFLDTTQEQWEWCAFIDIDEFIWTPGVDPLLTLLRRFTYASIVAAHWVLFGSSGYDTKQDGLVIERFTYRQRGVDRHVKSIVRSGTGVSAWSNPHAFKTTGVVTDSSHRHLDGQYGLTENGIEYPLVIFHYHTKSRAEYFDRKLTKPDANSGRTYDEARVQVMFDAHDRNEVADSRLCKFAPLIYTAIKHNV